MSNVYFKRGLQASLPSNSANIVDGAFYLTTDTNRLYVGKRNAADTENVGDIARKTPLIQKNRRLGVDFLKLR